MKYTEKIKILDLNSLCRVHWEYVMGILRKNGKPMDMEQVCNYVLEDGSKDPEFRHAVITEIIDCRAYTPVG